MTTQQWLSDAAEALGRVTPEGAPLPMTWDEVLTAIRETRKVAARAQEITRQVIADGIKLKREYSATITELVEVIEDRLAKCKCIESTGKS